MPAVTEYLRRALAPRIVVATSRMRSLQRWRAAARRALNLPLPIELFFAFDDPYAAIALPGLIKIAELHGARLLLRPLIARGIDGDPAAAQRSLHAITDSRRLAQRDGRNLRRNAPLRAADTAFLAEWTAAAQRHPKLNQFVSAALIQLWFGSDDLPTPASYAALYQTHMGSTAPTTSPEQGEQLKKNSERLHQLGHWESPTAYVAGEWFFAHERLEQIDAHLHSLGA